MENKLYTGLLTLFIACFHTLVPAQVHWESLVLESDQFKYLVPETAPSNDWKQLTFDDSSWDIGNGGFGYGDGDDQTVVSATTSIYLRKVVTIPTGLPVLRLLLDIDYDDAFVAYLNGAEIARSPNLQAPEPGLAETLTYDHEAVMYSGGKPERFFLDPEDLVEGDNILAVHILNWTISSSDLSARVFLNAEIDSDGILFNNTPDWFTEPVIITSNLPVIKINTSGQAIPDEPKITAQMQVINNPDGTNSFADTNYEYDGYIGIEIRGNTAQMFPKKSYTIETRLSTGENNNVPLLGMPAENDWVLHGPYSDKSLMRNALAYYLGNLMGGWHPRTQFVELEINGEYRGVYLFVEKIKIDKNRVDIARLNPEDTIGDQLTGGYIISIDRDQEGSWNSPFMGRTGSVDVPFSYVDPKYDELTVHQRNYIREYITDFEYALDADSFKDPMYGYRSYIDIISFIDYFIITELSRDLDGYRVSVYFHKDKDCKGGKLTMYPFWDYNICFGNANFMEAGNPVGWAADGIGAGDWYEVPFWWDKFRTDPYFETLLRYRWEELRAQVLSKINIDNFIDSCSTLLEEPQVRNFEKWPVLNSYVWPNIYIGGTYENEVNYLKSWISDRIDWLDSQIETIIPIDTAGPTVITLDPVDITENSAKIGGNVTSSGASQVNERGIYWDTIPKNVLCGTKVKIGNGEGVFTAVLVDLEPGKDYYITAYAVNDIGVSYGQTLSFRASPGVVVPTVVTLEASVINENSAIVGGNITSGGGATVVERGIYWDTISNPEQTGTKVQVGSGAGSYTTTLSGLVTEKTYYFKAYAINEAGIAYGQTISFRTSSGIETPTVVTLEASGINENSAVVGGNITSDGGATVVDRGIYWDTISNPEQTGTKVQIGSGAGNFTTTLSGLAADKTYYFKAYAVNSVGISYGVEQNFTTSPDLTGMNETLLTEYNQVLVYPNPFSNSVTFEINLKSAGQVNITLYNILGELVGFRSCDCTAGKNRIEFTSKDFRSEGNMFFFSIISDNLPVRTGKIIRQ